ncbi:MAG: type VI secretion system tip protein VgrG [Deltaproteobacteria bacterium]|nr:type VI secretion system tip protein VgrG [Deltaproteobacteria bacterium]
MSDERVVPTPASSDLPSFRIICDGSEVSSEYHVLSVAVTKAINRIPFAEIRLLDGDAAKEDFEISNSGDFVPGAEIELLAGYHSDESTVFKGIITGHGIKSRANKPSLLVVECRDSAVKMTVGRQNAYYHDKKDSEIIEEILSEYGLDKEVESTEATHKEMVKYYSADWDFIVSRAEVNGKPVIVDDGKVFVKAPDTGQEPSLALVYGSTMMEFEAEMDARNQLGGIKSSSWDYASQEMIEEESEDPGLEEQGNVTASSLADVIGLDACPFRHTGHVADHELKAWANAGILKSRLSKIIGRVKCQGFAQIKPGHMLSLAGVGDRFNGLAFVTEVRQQITLKNWETDIQFGLSPKWFSRTESIMDRPASGLLPAVQGLQIGVVSQLQDDPDGEDRVLVKMPVIDPENDGIWARVAGLDAGEKRGAFFRPEIDDEVVLGFLNDDPRDPVVLGMLNSSARPAPITASDDNHEKGFVSRSEMKVIFNDDEISLTIETPNGNKIVLSDDAGSILLEDENGNKIEMNSDGITLESASDINVTASGDVNIEGTNTNIAASSQFKAEGSSGAEMTSSATATVKGSLVQIN